jgi:membrane-bound ClpP family serine protease
METLLIAIVIVAGIILMLIELFLIPGVSVAGAASLCCFVYAIFKSFVELGVAGGVITIIITAIACGLALNRFMRSKTLDRLALKKEIDSTVNKNNSAAVSIGNKGIAVTRLAQIGSAEIGGNIVEVKSDDGFIDEKTPIIVTRISDNIYVKRDNN